MLSSGRREQWFSSWPPGQGPPPSFFVEAQAQVDLSVSSVYPSVVRSPERVTEKSRERAMCSSLTAATHVVISVYIHSYCVRSASRVCLARLTWSCRVSRVAAARAHRCQIYREHTPGVARVPPESPAATRPLGSIQPFPDRNPTKYPPRVHEDRRHTLGQRFFRSGSPHYRYYCLYSSTSSYTFGCRVHHESCLVGGVPR